MVGGEEVWGLPRQRFHLKLKGIHERLWVWNIDVFGDIEKRKSACLKEIQKWDSLEEGALDEENRLARKVTKSEFDRILEMEEVMWR